MRTLLGHCLAGVVLIATSAASANTLSFMQALSGETGSVTGDDFTFKLPDFNPKLGMLTGLSVTFTGTVTDQVMFEAGAFGGSPPAGTYKAENNSSVNGGGFPNTTYNLAAGTFTIPADAEMATSTTTNVSYTAILNASGLGQYETGLPFGYETTGLEFGFLLFDSQGNRVNAADGETTFNVNAVETYTYTPVPEPGSLAIGAAGLLALAGLRLWPRNRSI